MKNSAKTGRIESSAYSKLEDYYKTLLKEGGGLRAYDPTIENGIVGKYNPSNQVIVQMYARKSNGGNVTIIPYIPGSTVKGAIREAIAYNSLKNNEPRLRQLASCLDRDRRRWVQQACFDALFMYDEPRRGHYDGKLDVLRFFEVSDFFPDDSYRLSLFEMQRISSGKKSISVQAIMISGGTFYGQINYVVPSDKLREKVDRKLTELMGLKTVSPKEDVERSILVHLRNYYGRKGGDSCEGKTPMRIGFGTGAEMKGITDLREEFKERYNNPKKHRYWPPKSHFSVNGKHPGQVCLEVI
ncbi:MAG: type III-A CRISPR-associated RAMP protein Csm5 [Thermoplasmatales archaeon]